MILIRVALVVCEFDRVVTDVIGGDQVFLPEQGNEVAGVVEIEGSALGKELIGPFGGSEGFERMRSGRRCHRLW